ncbi:hypothetical protein MYP_685 [Sporocytophaga myxococcoides]|uniref:Uncharacterized protein n=1 Tax=Sporocytophaga myxococcoides TaxID=153721 RepID=A0A098LB96_9BACT|nr:hypothetical protein [Sporocytophaga myxococcoides]GAL83458.1 hypothetical protein MYP_685 [Sporocytophaga myxococcoides]
MENFIEVEITFPQIVFEKKVVKIPEDQKKKLNNEADFIWENLTETEQDWSGGESAIRSAVDVDYCRVRILPKKS